jgi:hypothetical protein
MRKLKITDYCGGDLEAEVVSPDGFRAPRRGIAITSDDLDSGRDGQGLVILALDQAVALHRWLAEAIEELRTSV